MKLYLYALVLIFGAFLGWVLIDIDHLFTRLIFHIQYNVFFVFGLWVGLLLYTILFGRKS